MCVKTVIASSILSFGVILVAVGAGIGWGLIPPIINKAISEQVALKEGSEAWDLWKELPIPLQFKVYIFHVANADQVMTNGAKPVLEERGPYIYDEFRKKEDIILNGDKTMVSYHQYMSFVFNAELSGPEVDPSNSITVLNAALMGTLLTGDMEEGAARSILLSTISAVWSDIFPQAPNSVFVDTTVNDLLFAGIPINCQVERPLTTGFLWAQFCETLQSMNLDVIRPQFPGNKPTEQIFLYSFFDFKQRYPDGNYTINTGIKDVSKLGSILMWESSETLPFWEGEECNVLSGTDATIFPPFRTPESRLDIFSTDLCRSLYAAFETEMEYEGIPGLRYVASKDQLATAQQNPENYCWCAPDSGCLKEGSLDLFPCMGASVVLTFPHFYQSSPDYLAMVDGLNPQQNLHETFLDIEPNTGVPLSGGKRVQFNMMIKKIDYNPRTDKLPYALVPLLWIDEGVELDPPNVERLKNEVVNMLKLVDGIRWGVVGVGIASTLIGAILLFVWCF